VQGSKRGGPSPPVFPSVHYVSGSEQWVDPTHMFTNGLGRLSRPTSGIGVMGVDGAYSPAGDHCLYRRFRSTIMDQAGVYPA